MSDPGPPMDGRISRPGDAELDLFAEHLAEFSASLNEREQRTLWHLLVRGMDPVQRMTFRDPADLLDPEQRAFLASLDADDGQG